MRLTAAQIARLSPLLDVLLSLPESEREAWIQRLSPEHRDLSAALREILQLQRDPAALVRALDTLPKMRGNETPNGAGSGLSAGTRVGPYELMRILGSGGMAEVWLARRADGAFKREVALKLPLLSRRRGDLEARFVRECDILAQLEHPGIARLYDAGIDSDGMPYLSMEYVQGETLLAWCDARATPIAERLKLFQQVLAAVRYAHDKQVIHRDLKPSNILVRHSGEIQLLDFGVAKLLEPEGGPEGEGLSKVYGQALTPDYASPEVLAGASGDPRSDVYSLGMVLYELLCGARPYRLPPAELLAARSPLAELAAVPPPSAYVTHEASAARGTSAEKLAQALRGDLDAIVLKAMARDPAQRYESVASFAADLERYARSEPVLAHATSAFLRARKFLRRHRAALRSWGVLAGAGVALAVAMSFTARHRIAPASASFHPPAHSVAVLPFSNLSEDPQQDYFSDGLSEELINALTQVAALQVCARTSSFAFKGHLEDIKQIGRKLNVGAVIEGSVRRAGDRVRVTAQLIDAANGYHMWSQNYDRTLSDVLSLQSDIALTVAREMRIRLLGGEGERMEVGGTRSPAAYDAYLRGKHVASRAQRSADYRLALEAFDQALQTDPTYAAAHAQRARMLRLLAFDSRDPEEQGGLYAQARAAAQRAIELAPDYADGHMVLGWHILTNGYLELAAAQREIERAVSLAPGSASVLDGYAGFEGLMGRHERALEAMRHALRLDPRNLSYREHLLGNLTWAHRFGEAKAAALALQREEPDSAYAAYYLAFNELAMGFAARARQQCTAARTRLEPSDRHLCLALAEHALGNRERAARELALVMAEDGDLGAAKYAAIHAQWKEPRAAMKWLHRAKQVYKASLHRIRVDWMFDPLRGDPEFASFEAELGFPPEEGRSGAAPP